ncbi:hypothetical protein CRG98_008492 [Punica granatum]|uniref:Uncharacterized protein n=1 Tax=Punica granatum TaxID=22663 RepID=A0A2I0KRJ4_PUNGR|nr:hypothetical protein CRG98_008492 [Punica granatum]
MTTQAAELASGKAQSFLNSKAGFRQPNRCASAQGSVPFGYVPTTFLLRGQSPSGVRPLRVRPNYISAQGSVPFGYVPITFLLRGQSPSGTSRLNFYSGFRPLRVRPDIKFPCTMQPAGQNAPVRTRMWTLVEARIARF